MGKTILVLGGRSEIGVASAQRLLTVDEWKASTVILAARRADLLADEEAKILDAGAAKVRRIEFDANALSTHENFAAEIFSQHSSIDVAIVAFGILGNQEEAERDAKHALAIIHTDFVAQVSVLTHLANHFRAQGQGDIVVFSSVAGVRVRRANYVYGSAKAGLDGFASGLSDALSAANVRVLVIRPGFVIGRMTTGMTPAPFSSTPEQVADAVTRALVRGKRDVWVPGILRPVFALLRMLPRSVWKRMPR